MTLLDAALAYAARGWPVFPVHTPDASGKCSCRKSDCDRVGKHPRISKGRNGASTDREVIERWWSVWPDANIGIATGADSGLIVLDVDDGGEDSLVGRDLPDTVEQITGSGGRHLLYARPEGDAYRTRVRFLPGLDSRADGGYIVAPPSLHPSGRHYHWEASSDPTDGVDVADAPGWLLDALRSQPVDAQSEVPAWDPDGDLPETITAMLSAIPADDYEVWRDVGLALHYTDPADGLDVWDWWSSTAANYSPDAVRREWRNFSRRGHQSSNPVTIATVRRLAERHGWIDPDAEHGAGVAATLIESHQRKQAEQIIASHQSHQPPGPLDAPEIMPPHGLIRDIAEHILSRSVRPQPLLAVMAAAAFVGTLAGRKYQTETGLRTNLYVIGLAGSGGGKDQARKEISNLAMAAGLDDLVGGDRIASGPAVVSALAKSPSRIFLIDEIGLMLQSMTGASGRVDSVKRDLMATLMTMYSSAGGVYRGVEYADQKTRPRQDIVNPNAVVYGTSTHAAFYAAITSSQGVDGTLSRLIVVSGDENRPARKRPTLGQPDAGLVARIRALGNHSTSAGNLAGIAGSGVDVVAQVVRMERDVFDAWEALDDDMTDYMTTDAAQSVYSRVAENAAKLALVYAVSIDHHHPVIDSDAFAWGREISLWAANLLMREVANRAADNEVEREIKQVMGSIRQAGSDGITRRELLRRHRSIRQKDLGEICTRLVDSGEAQMMTRKNSHGPATIVYLALD